MLGDPERVWISYFLPRKLLITIVSFDFNLYCLLCPFSLTSIASSVKNPVWSINLGRQSVLWTDVFPHIRNPKLLWDVWKPAKTLDNMTPKELWNWWSVGEVVFEENSGQKPPIRLVEQHFKAKWRSSATVFFFLSDFEPGLISRRQEKTGNAFEKSLSGLKARSQRDRSRQKTVSRIWQPSKQRMRLGALLISRLC
jgi:hypothetical protein